MAVSLRVRGVTGRRICEAAQFNRILSNGELPRRLFRRGIELQLTSRRHRHDHRGIQVIGGFGCTRGARVVRVVAIIVAALQAGSPVNGLVDRVGQYLDCHIGGAIGLGIGSTNPCLSRRKAAADGETCGGTADCRARHVFPPLATGCRYSDVRVDGIGPPATFSACITKVVAGHLVIGDL